MDEQPTKPVKVQGLGNLIYSISLRDLFALGALVGMCRDYVASKTGMRIAAKDAYLMADAMLKARDKE